MTKLVIFDLDETLLRIPVDWNRVREEVIAYGKKEGVKFDESLHILPVSSAISNTKKRKSAVDSIYRRAELELINSKGIERYPKAEEYVKKLKEKGIKLAVFSNNNHESIEKALAQAGIVQYFDLIMGRDDVEKTKPDPEGIFFILKKLDVKKSEAILIGDSESDRKAGEKAKIRAIIVKPNSQFSILS